ncbi:glycosyltransferase family 4 protein [Mucilaginibacter corticis]|uniref:Glycosyltransferase family 4 protein n=1 Tax=Mucilaginibacter corticis TaxID=2597670 RepID=A0A556M839_9SPHI|nr:glycosyltransferase family 4 protein [Mucilaginibacter corticis]TSJ35956.1 glycosyltransferase family 4 protein [Mucilaginibacter corticis]
MSKRLMLFTLQTFSTTGGIQKMTRALAHSLSGLSYGNDWDFSLWSVYDADRDLMPQYVPKGNFLGFNHNRIKFILKTMINARKIDVVILSHLNLALAGLLLKMINPKCKVFLVAHGIEVWRPISVLKKIFLRHCDKVICVSNFTMQQMISRHHCAPFKCTVLNNTIDPFMEFPVAFNKPDHLIKKYSIDNHNEVLFTLSRLASTEQYKGHDQVIRALSRLKERFPRIKYILSGQYDENEKIRIEKLIADYQVGGHVILTGFLKEEELIPHFLLADLFVLPSKKEGFGIVFIEAMACGVPVICGNVDGSIDAVYSSELGTAINPDDLVQLEAEIAGYLKNKLTVDAKKNIQTQCLSHFNEKNYMIQLAEMIKNG